MEPNFLPKIFFPQNLLFPPLNNNLSLNLTPSLLNNNNILEMKIVENVKIVTESLTRIHPRE